MFMYQEGSTRVVIFAKSQPMGLGREMHPNNTVKSEDIIYRQEGQFARLFATRANRKDVLQQFGGVSDSAEFVGDPSR